MKKVEVHRIHENGEIAPYYDVIITDIDTDERIMYLFGLQFGFVMEKVKDNIWTTQYGATYIVVRLEDSQEYKDCFTTKSMTNKPCMNCPFKMKCGSYDDEIWEI